MYKIAYIFFFFSFLSFSQVGINTTSPDPSSILDISSLNKGLLIPRVPLVGLTDETTIVSPTKGLLVFNTGVVGMPEGFYFWDGSQWQKLKSDLADAWLLEGNTATASHALGTNNVMPLLLKTNNQTVANFHPSGGIRIGLEGSANTSDAIAIGRLASANSLNNIAIGMGSQSSGNNTFALGTYAVASGDFAVAVGTEASAVGGNSTAFGHLAKASGQNAVAVGGGSEALQLSAVALGPYATANGKNSTAFGNSAKALGDEAVAIGGGAKAQQLSAVALGPYSLASAEKSFALGPNAEASATNSFALGIGAKANVANTVIIGEVKTGNIDITPVNIGIGTKSPKARLDVHGTFKLGEKGNVLKGINGFTTTIGASTNIPANESVVVSFSIPSANQPGATQATINSTLASATNGAIAISWAKFDGIDKINVKFRNESDTTVNIDTTTINFTIIEF